MDYGDLTEQQKRKAIEMVGIGSIGKYDYSVSGGRLSATHRITGDTFTCDCD